MIHNIDRVIDCLIIQSISQSICLLQKYFENTANKTIYIGLGLVLV